MLLLFPVSLRMMMFRVVSLTFVVISMVCIAMIYDELEHKSHFALNPRPIALDLPDSKPPMNQESVELAMKMFGIEVPEGVEYPSFDPNLEDRGLTTLNGWGRNLEVTVGPAAFHSWGLLGSTLAHELEVHCRQSFMMIRVKDMLGLKGTEEAERQAYQHELVNAERFGLKTSDQLSIRATMDYYYPVAQLSSNTETRPVR